MDAVQLILEVNGYQTACTYDGADVLNMQGAKPDLVVLDIWMSGDDGRDICRELKSCESTKNIPVLMVSASRDIRKSALAAGANDFLEKPFDMNVLLNKIDCLIKNHTV